MTMNNNNNNNNNCENIKNSINHILPTAVNTIDFLLNRGEYRKAFGLFVQTLENLNEEERQTCIQYYSRNQQLKFGLSLLE